MKKCDVFLFILSLCFILISFIGYKKIKEQNIIITELKYQVDSLDSELYPINIELTRHQVALTIFFERNPKAAQEYSDIISNETE